MGSCEQWCHQNNTGESKSAEHLYNQNSFSGRRPKKENNSGKADASESRSLVMREQLWRAKGHNIGMDFANTHR